MPPEATMIIVDNSEYMRNGDYAPTRFGAQSDAVSVIFGTKTQSNPENTVGVMTMAGKTPEVLVTPTPDVGKILSALHGLKINGEADIVTGIQIAQLALKHRQNKNQRQRIIVFVGSPLAADEKTLIKLGKRLKKNNVSIDIISFGEEENDARLRAFVEAVSSSDNSHMLSVPSGLHLLSDVIISSPILSGDRGIPGGLDSGVPNSANGSGQDFEFGVDPSLDPELAMVWTSTETPAAPAADADTLMDAADEDEEALLAQALALSQSEDMEMADEADLDEAEAIARAIRESHDEDGRDSAK
ncbi:uncharacterized protein EI90DRAFT_3144927 [Cantharellus anzutake]|uniref:uncharacterized protein n=1 Tax=Cantharellus anzutake TaxID=1750568 RepID=UPI001904FA11|nr:uncharacterized protein EI90DRAFT_3144927 [Cantharellus anzutake]KAF8335003.1 hypothetical protein EI90DRAFT_3144927 [Cantharellus anzutake]